MGARMVSVASFLRQNDKRRRRWGTIVTFERIRTRV